MTGAEVATFVLQGGNLALLAVVLGGFYRLARAAIPIVQALVETLAELREGLANVRGELHAMHLRLGEVERRGICPMVVAREEKADGRSTEPDVPG